MKIVRRHGSSPKERCSTNISCPDVLELADGNFAVIGLDATEELDGELIDVEAARGAHERIVVLPREVMLAALGDIRKSQTPD
ncbi:hypothetical protein O7635_04090 [Asanoa sp. WMMD1127]|uniref:hypothetical protein n=1 Tax=Asanoa sp. WMMD1127 TaxID=3016107 RepID=UPI0024167220|nr:hypothetical protein [Asanoa sp. WMMD1127]MDG4821033.1 hypothetical protein [Asanoa sp. WMMD1127]